MLFQCLFRVITGEALFSSSHRVKSIGFRTPYKDNPAEGPKRPGIEDESNLVMVMLLIRHRLRHCRKMLPR
jgi:hypothetical protein